ncbi:MAG: hypothetical protein K6E36_11755 [Oscillospiraceae bacterium]|nr:hypothetical protein [Oscillospiraceae bacterium]
MKAIMNNPALSAMSLYSFEYQYRFFLRQEESAFVLHAKHTGICSAALTG